MATLAIERDRVIVEPCFSDLQIYLFFKKEMVQFGLFFAYFRSFQTNIITIFTTNISEKCPSSIRYRDLNPQPLERETLPITTRPGLPPRFTNFVSDVFATFIELKFCHGTLFKLTRSNNSLSMVFQMFVL